MDLILIFSGWTTVGTSSVSRPTSSVVRPRWPTWPSRPLPGSSCPRTTTTGWSSATTRWSGWKSRWLPSRLPASPGSSTTSQSLRVRTCRLRSQTLSPAWGLGLPKGGTVGNSGELSLRIKPFPQQPHSQGFGSERERRGLGLDPGDGDGSTVPSWPTGCDRHHRNHLCP